MVAEEEARTAGGEMTLIEHLTELRQRVIKSVIAVVVGGVVCLIFSGRIIDAIVQPYCRTLETLDDDRLLIAAEDCALVQTQPLEGFSLVLTIAGYGGFVLATPVVLWQLWQFIVPGLYAHEKRFAIPFVFSGVVLFFSGAGLAFWSIPRALEFLLNVGDFVSLLTPGPYINFVVRFIVAFGIGFQFPLVLVMLQLVGVVDYKQLGSGRRYAIVGIIVLVAVLTPSGDPQTLLILSIPMYLFYEIAIVFGWIRARRKNKLAARAQ